MVDLSTYLSRIGTGRCIVLTGAAFSAGAENYEGKSIPDTKTLTKRILDNVLVKTSDQTDFDLGTATSKFLRDTNNDVRRLVDLIAPALTAKSSTKSQNTISALPWHRIFTTNFDNVHEVALQSDTKLSESFSRDGDVQARSKSRQQVIHLHGFVGETNPTNDPHRFILSLESYAEQRLQDSKWLNQFRTNVRGAAAVFVIGYSLSDTHLGNIFLTDETIHEKTAVITEKNPSLAVSERLQTFGQVFPVGVNGFSRASTGIVLSSPSTQYKPDSLLEILAGDERDYDARDVDDLLMKGKFDVGLMNRQIIRKQSPQYFVEWADDLFKQLHQMKGRRIAIVQSDIGNGKTVFVNELGAKLKNAAYRVFVLNAERDNRAALQEAATFLEYVSENTAIIIEDFWRQQAALDLFTNIGRTNILFIFTSRSVVFELNFPKIDSDYRGRYIEVNLNHLSRLQASEWIDFLISYGYWRERAALSQIQKENYIMNQCHGEVRGILLALLESPIFKQKLDQYFSKINKLEPALREAIILSTFLTVVNFSPNHAYFLSIVMDKDYQRQLPSAPDSSEIFEIITRKGDLAFKSAVFGEYFLREFIGKNELIEILTGFADKLDKKRYSMPIYSDLLRRMLRFSSFIFLRKKGESTDFIIDYFNKNSNLDIAKSDPLYWVQYSISRMDRGEYKLCENYIAQAYGIAKARKSYDTYQIDTHQARFLLESRIEDFKTDYFSAFQKAHQLIHRVLDRREEDLIYPLEVTHLYLDFFYKHKSKLTEKEVKSIIDSSKIILDKMQQYPPQLLERNSIGNTTKKKMAELEMIARPYL